MEGIDATEYFYDAQSKNWGFRVRKRGIVGGAKTREEAEKLAAEAIQFAQEPVMEPKGGGGRIRRRLAWAKFPRKRSRRH